MSLNKCARCDQTVYPVEGLRCLDKLWHKGCFKCHECNMTLNMKNYKGFEKRPYCNAHCPQAKATTVADTPEIRRLAENTRIQSQAKYHEDFEKSKGKGFTAVTDDPETRRIKETSKIISNVAYHGELEKKKQMEERRGLSGTEDLPLIKNNNNNNMKHLNRMSQNIDSDYSPSRQVANNNDQNHMMQQQHQQRQLQIQHQHQQQLLQKQHQQQLLLKQQQQQQQQHYAQNGQPMANRQSGQFDGAAHHQQLAPRHGSQPQYTTNQAQQQQMMIQRQHQQQQQIIMQSQQQRQSIDANIQMTRQPSKQTLGNHQQQNLMKQHSQLMTPQQQQQLLLQQQQQQQQQPNMMKYVPMNDNMVANQAIPPQLIGAPAHLANHQAQMGGSLVNGQRVLGPTIGGGGPQQPQLAHGYQHSHQINPLMNGIIPKQQSQSNFASAQPQHHPNQLRQLNHHPSQQMQPNRQIPMQQHILSAQQQQQQLARRVFRAMYDYIANDVDEVSFYENDILVDCVNVDRNWLIGKVARTGQTGMLPANYVVELPGQ